MNTFNSTSNYIKFNCIYCGQHLECAPRLAGRQFLCPSCEHRIVIPNLRGGNPVGRALTAACSWDEFVPWPDVEVPTRYRTRIPEKSALACAA